MLWLVLKPITTRIPPFRPALEDRIGGRLCGPRQVDVNDAVTWVEGVAQRWKYDDEKRPNYLHV